MTDLIRDSFFGQLVYYASGKRLFQHPEEQPGFVVPERYHTMPMPASETATLANAGDLKDREKTTLSISETMESAEESSFAREVLHPSSLDVEKGHFTERVESKQSDESYNVVHWYDHNDPANPMNWSLKKRIFVTFDICFLTFSIYIGSAIYAPGILGVSEQFGVSDTAATLGLTLFVIGYGIGPMFLSPLSEVPQFGRTSVYIVTLFLFVVLQVPTALAKNLGALLPLRFLAGFFGSPALATGGASLADIWGPESRATVVGLWGLAAVCGPVLGPLVGGFAAEAKDWTWTIWILLWVSGASLLWLTFLLPETSAQAILYRRAVRLRKLTGNPDIKSQGEIEADKMQVKDLAMSTLIRPFILGFTEPIVICWNLYITLVYSILYIFVESFGIVFIELHGFTLGQNGLAFLGLLCGCVIGFMCFVPYCEIKLRPIFRKGYEYWVPEERLPVAMVGSVLLPISMFWFGWTSVSSVHWIVPIIGSALFSAGTYLMFQAGLNYLCDCYPRHLASVLAGNDFFRSIVGAAFPLFSSAFFRNLGVGQACSVLGGVAVAMMPIPFVMYKYGKRIRAYSKYAD